MARTPAKAAVIWGLIGFVAGLAVTLALAFASAKPGEPRDAMRKRGEAAAPAVVIFAAIPAAIAYLVTKRRQG
jgi:hypothetical protein